jgi:hypothetical protein
MGLEELLWIIAIGGFSYGCSICTGAEIREWLKSAAVVTIVMIILIAVGYWLLLAL